MITLGTANSAHFDEHFLFEHDGINHSVFTKGAGPGVVLMHELPGMSPEFWRLANWLAEHFTVWAPDMFGNKTRPTPAKPGALFMKACISREIHLFSKDDPGPITQWLRALSKAMHAQTGGPGVGVIGMCMSGNFALTLALDPWVTAPISSQPGLPASTPFANRDGGLQMTQDERAQLANERDVDVMALRFEGDALCKAARFDAIRDLVGEDRFQEHVIADEHRNPDGPLKLPHSVLTADLVDDDDGVTKQKLGEVITFLKARIETADA
ncbi:MAG: alpha/beta fold hydrolase [Pseudomonadota bacterium]